MLLSLELEQGGGQATGAQSLKIILA